MKLIVRRLFFSVLLLLCSIEAIRTQSEVKSETKKSLLKKNAKLKKFDPNTATTRSTTTTTTQTITSVTEAPEPEPDNKIARLRKMLLKNYDKKIHPVKDWTSPVQVRASITNGVLLHINISSLLKILRLMLAWL